MQLRVRQVPGGYELFIPDELAAKTGISAEVLLEVDEMADMLMVRQEEFVQAKRAAAWANFHPSQLHDPHEPYPLPPGMELPNR
jgi:hypothetical protein